MSDEQITEFIDALKDWIRAEIREARDDNAWPIGTWGEEDALRGVMRRLFPEEVA